MRRETRHCFSFRYLDCGFHSLTRFALAQNGPGQWAVLGRLDDAFRTGLPQAEAALGCSLYQYYSRVERADEAKAYR